MRSPNYNNNVFINCPFDSAYKPLFDAIVFAVYDCGFITRCALEEDDASEVRIDQIYNIIADCRYGIHDISRTELDEDSGLPRFNMPLELGIFLGAKKFAISSFGIQKIVKKCHETLVLLTVSLVLIQQTCQYSNMGKYTLLPHRMLTLLKKETNNVKV